MEGSLPGSYELACQQTLYGIPIADRVKAGLNDAFFLLPDDVDGVFPGFDIRCLSDDAWELTASGTVLPREIRTADVPLAPLGEVIAAIEAEIEAGHVRAVYSLSLQYVLCEDGAGEYLVCPAWIMKGLYVDNPRDELSTRYGPIGEHFDDPVEYGCYPIWAQTAAFCSPQTVRSMFRSDDGRGQRLAMPDIITWEDVQ